MAACQRASGRGLSAGLNAGFMLQRMMYYAYQAQDDLIDPFRVFAQSALDVIENSWLRRSGIPFLGNVSAAYELMTRARLTHHRPPYRIDAVKIGNREVAVTEGDKAAEKIGARFAGQPDLEAGGRAVLGQTYNRLGQFQKAEAMIRTALPLYLANRGEDHPDTLELRNELANALSGLGSDAEAIQVYRDLIPRCDRVLAPDDTLRAATRSSLGAILRRAGRLDEAESLLREALDLAGRFAGDATETRLGAASNLALLLEERGRADQAEPLLLESWKAYEGGNEHPSVLVGAANYANLIAERGEFDRAVPMLERLVESHRRVLGTDHAGTLGVTGLLAGLMVAADRFENAGQHGLAVRFERLCGDVYSSKHDVIVVGGFPQPRSMRRYPAFCCEFAMRKGLDVMVPL